MSQLFQKIGDAISGVGIDWLITERPVMLLWSNVCIITSEPLPEPVRRWIKEQILWTVPAAYRLDLTFAHPKKEAFDA